MHGTQGLIEFPRQGKMNRSLSSRGLQSESKEGREGGEEREGRMSLRKCRWREVLFGFYNFLNFYFIYYSIKLTN